MRLLRRTCGTPRNDESVGITSESALPRNNGNRNIPCNNERKSIFAIAKRGYA